MNVRNKIVALAMSFIICFCTVSNSYAYDKKHIEGRLVGGVISAPILAVVATSALATGYAIKNIDDVYALGSRFVEYCGSEFSDMVSTFENSVRITATGAVLVGTAFLTYLQGFFKHDSKSGLLGYWGALPVYGSHDMVTSTWDVPIIEDDVERKYIFNTNGGSNSNETYKLTVTCYSPGNSQYDYYAGRQVMYDLSNNHGLSNIPKFLDALQFYAIAGASYYDVYMKNGKEFFNNGAPIHMGTMAIKYQPALTGGIGAFDENALDNAKDKNGDLPLHVPQNLGDLPKADKDSVISNGSNPPYDLPIGGTVSVPQSGVDSSLGVDSSISFPTVNDTPSDVPGTSNPGIVFPPFGGGLDFSPITQSSFSDKFPFSLAKDIKNIISVFDVEPKAPKFTVPIVSEELEIDLTQFNVWASIIRFFVLIGFMISLINITRKVIG